MDTNEHEKGRLAAGARHYREAFRVANGTVKVAILFVVLLAQSIRADSTWVYAVQISADVQDSPPAITLKWPADPYGANSYTIERKQRDAGSWNQIANLGGGARNYTDGNVAVGNTYEYQIVKAGSVGYTGYGYIYAGIAAPLVEKRGKIVLIVDNSTASSLTSELNRLQGDLVGDGWIVLRHNVERDASPVSVKTLITGDYWADPGNVKAVFLFGHVPIFRCGNLNVDGHQARPMPADTFYADVDGWGNPDTLPSDAELMVGRVDMRNLPAAGSSELELLRNYLNKDHNWRHNITQAPRRALVGNRFGDFGGEAFAASGFRNLEPFVGPGNIVIANEQDNAPVEQRWSSMLASQRYLWAYGCGGGSYSSMSGLGTHGTYDDVWSSDLIQQDAKAVFYMMFGSWLGEWDSQDNLMRAALATPTMGLACSWAGRPHWYYHHMALGEPIGFSARVSMNNGGLYGNQVNQFTRGVHMALMGDPTLRADPVTPPSGLSASGGRITWSASPDGVGGYHVYRAGAGGFARINGSLVQGTSFTDASGGGDAAYMVRAVKLERTPSGTYYNASQGVFANNGGGGSPPPPSPPPTPPPAPKPAVPGSKTVWLEDKLPGGSTGFGDSGDTWDWVSGRRFSGNFAHRSVAAEGYHQHYFDYATKVLSVKVGEVLYAYVYLEAKNPPAEVMLQWSDGSWEHRAYWGRNLIPEGVNGTASRRRMGALPPLGQWVRLEVPASAVGLQGKSLQGMAFSLYGGRAWWDQAGKLTPK